MRTNLARGEGGVITLTRWVSEKPRAATMIGTTEGSAFLVIFSAQMQTHIKTYIRARATAVLCFPPPPPVLGCSSIGCGDGGCGGGDCMF